MAEWKIPIGARVYFALTPPLQQLVGWEAGWSRGGRTSLPRNAASSRGGVSNPLPLLPTR